MLGSKSLNKFKIIQLLGIFLATIVLTVPIVVAAVSFVDGAVDLDDANWIEGPSGTANDLTTYIEDHDGNHGGGSSAPIGQYIVYTTAGEGDYVRWSKSATFQDNWEMEIEMKTKQLTTRLASDPATNAWARGFAFQIWTGTHRYRFGFSNQSIGVEGSNEGVINIPSLISEDQYYTWLIDSPDENTMYFYKDVDGDGDFEASELKATFTGINVDDTSSDQIYMIASSLASDPLRDDLEVYIRGMFATY